MTLLSKFRTDQSAAVAAMYALALPVLVAMAGIGFDYARIASMDSELQNAADQAALAGATQLDQQAGSIARAVSAVQGGLVSNSTLFANDGSGSDVDIPTAQIYFYANRADAEAAVDALDPADEDSDLEAAFIRVQVETRTANFALTPVVGALSGSLDAEAVAGVGAALCRTPPLMICNPFEPAGNTDPTFDFDPDSYAGRGLLAKGGGGSFWAPGNFGYLDTIPGAGGGTPDLRKALGWDSPSGQCISQTANDAVDTDTGNKTDIADSMNTRFDIYNGNTACPNGGSCSASINSMKDVVHPTSPSGGGNACKLHNDGWHEPTTRYLPPSNAAWNPATPPDSMGHPRDICHSTATNTCSGAGPLGDGVWDRDLYFRVHYLRTSDGVGGAAGTRWTPAQWQSNTGLGASASRYDVYKWEIDHEGDVIDGVQVLAGPTSSFAYGTPVCGTPKTPDEFTVDRRRLSVAVINCVAHGVRGNSTEVPVRRFMDVFLVQPSLNRDRTAKDEIYVEIIGKTLAGSEGETAGTVIRRDVPFLIR